MYPNSRPNEDFNIICRSWELCHTDRTAALQRTGGTQEQTLSKWENYNQKYALVHLPVPMIPPMLIRRMVKYMEIWGSWGGRPDHCDVAIFQLSHKPVLSSKWVCIGFILFSQWSTLGGVLLLGSKGCFNPRTLLYLFDGWHLPAISLLQSV